MGVVLLPLLVGGCAAEPCLPIGAVGGIRVEVARGADPTGRAHRLAVEVCDGGACGRAEVTLRRVPGRSPPAFVGPDDLGLALGPGTVEVAVELADRAGEVLARTRQRVRLTGSDPDGAGCGSDEVVSGSLEVRAADRV